MRVLKILMLLFLLSSFNKDKRLTIFFLCEKKAWSFEKSKTYINNTMNYSEYLCLDRKKNFIYRKYGCGPCGLAVGTYEKKGDTLIFDWDKNKSKQYTIENNKKDTIFIYVSKSFSKIKYLKKHKKLILLNAI
ncbi:MAG: hypothetical protein QM535_04435 [Limnohabitans sp.]|nr:hypothetical protein [Limnohabitans sp.]